MSDVMACHIVGCVYVGMMPLKILHSLFIELVEPLAWAEMVHKRYHLFLHHQSILPSIDYHSNVDVTIGQYMLAIAYICIVTAGHALVYLTPKEETYIGMFVPLSIHSIFDYCFSYSNSAIISYCTSMLTYFGHAYICVCACLFNVFVPSVDIRWFVELLKVKKVPIDSWPLPPSSDQLPNCLEQVCYHPLLVSLPSTCLMLLLC